MKVFRRQGGGGWGGRGSVGGGTFSRLSLLPKLLHQLPHSSIDLHLILVADAVLTQEVKFDMVLRLLHAFHILHLQFSASEVCIKSLACNCSLTYSAAFKV